MTRDAVHPGHDLAMAHARFLDEHFGPMPALPAPPWLRFFGFIASIPSWARPAALGAVALAAPYAFGEKVIDDRTGLVAFAIISAFFGPFVGHSWFGKRTAD